MKTTASFGSLTDAGALLVTSLLLLSLSSTRALVPLRNPSTPRPSGTRRSATTESSRRAWLATLTTSVVSVATIVAGSPVEPAAATYSAYANREKDWQTRLDSGDVQISTPKDLRAQLREIAPMNVNDKIFCPNGPSAAVSPLMENKCGERQALPSVYGRSQDVVGNSIPGFTTSGGVYLRGESSSSLSADVGGFPSYGGK